MAETPTCPKCGDSAQRYAYLEEENRLRLTCCRLTRGASASRSRRAHVYEIRRGQWQTPRGRSVELVYRADTNDWNVISSVMAPHDEYGLAGLPELEGWALDLGAHIGAVTVALLADHPELAVFAVEPVPPNMEMFWCNAQPYADRIQGWCAAIGPPDVATTVVRYGYRGTELAEHHAYIGNSMLVYPEGGALEHEEIEVPVLNLGALEEWRLALGYTGRASFTKLDTEGGEWDFLAGGDPRILGRIHGEWHPTGGHVQADLVALLDATHELTFSGPVAGPGGFVAVPR